MPNRPPTPVQQEIAPPPAQAIITIPPMENFDDVRQVLAQVIRQTKAWILGQLPPTNFRGKRISNVGIPQGPDDVVTLRYLTTTQSGISTTAVAPNVNTVSGGGGASGANLYVEVNTTAATTIIPPTSTAGTLLIYKIKQAGTAYAITWGTSGSIVFNGAPPMPLYINTNSVVTFVCGSDLNWYIQSAMLGFTK